MFITIKERGWAGHFICSDRCQYHRNTLLTNGVNHIVVSTVGDLFINGQPETLGLRRYYETMCFYGEEDMGFIVPDVSKQITEGLKCEICSDSYEDLPENVKMLADEMHDNYVNYVHENFGEILEHYIPQWNERGK